jgi:outer membrane protein OmpA-like peptidoglycan-associated protein
LCPIFAFACALGGLGCARTPPPRPVPQNEAKRPLPPWFPEKEWTAAAGSEREFLVGKVVFATAKHDLRPEAERVLTKLLDYMNANPDVSRLRLEGHTDSRASEEFNQGLSERRAIAVADWLVDRGLDHFRLLAVAFGETRPLVPNKGAANLQENRRVEFHIAEVSGNRFRGEDPTAGGLVLSIRSKEERERDKLVGKVPEPPPPPPLEGDVIKPIAKEKLRPILPSEEGAPEPAKK